MKCLLNQSVVIVSRHDRKRILVCLQATRECNSNARQHWQGSVYVKGADLGRRGDFNPEGLCLGSPTARNAPVMLRLHHLVLIFYMGSQAVPRGFIVAPGTARGVLTHLRRGLGGAILGGGAGWRRPRDPDLGRGLAGSGGGGDAIACNPDLRSQPLSCGMPICPPMRLCASSICQCICSIATRMATDVDS